MYTEIFHINFAITLTGIKVNDEGFNELLFNFRIWSVGRTSVTSTYAVWTPQAVQTLMTPYTVGTSQMGTSRYTYSISLPLWRPHRIQCLYTDH